MSTEAPDGKRTEASDGKRQNISLPDMPPVDAAMLLRPFDHIKEGDTFTSRSRTITEADVVGFAALSGDWHPAHTDQSWAESNMFGQRVAHGMLLVSIAMGLVPNDYILALRRMRHIIFKKPAFFGDTIRVEGKAARITEMSEEVGLVTGRWRVVNQSDETLVKMELDALWRRS